MQRQPRLSKSRFLSGLQCERRLWLGWHDPIAVAAPPGSVLAIGHEVGSLAQRLFPGGILVEEGPRDFLVALEKTRALVGDPVVTSIFEAAFAFNNVVIRADIIERVDEDRWKLHEVKSSTRQKPEHIKDLMIQTYVIEGCGLVVDRAKLVHINTKYERGCGPIDVESFFSSFDATSDVRKDLPDAPAKVTSMLSVLQLAAPPERGPSFHCFKPFACEFWDRCTQSKPKDWVWHLPKLTPKQFTDLATAGIDEIDKIPEEFPLTGPQLRQVQATHDGGFLVQSGLARALPAIQPGCSYLDFETFSPAIPLYSGTRPYQRIPAQWSLHQRSGDGTLRHVDFLASLEEDPRRAFVESLIESTACCDPVIVYSPFERSVIGELRLLFPEYDAQLEHLQKKLVDLLPVVRGFVDHPRFQGSKSIKTIAPVFAPQLDYGALDGVVDGSDASAAIWRLAAGQLMPGETKEQAREHLLRYCALDTLALAHVHTGLVGLAESAET